MTLDWALSGFHIKGEFADGPFTVFMRSEYDQRFAVEADGVFTERPLLKAGEGSFSFRLPFGAHELKVLKDTEVSKKGQRSEMCGISFSGRLLGKPEAPKMRIEIIGDSISSGLGSLGRYKAGEAWSFEDHSAVHSFSYLVPKALGAEADVISKGGIGVVKEEGGRTMPELYPYLAGYRDTETRYDFSKVHTDMVFLELSGNDGKQPEEALKKGYPAFIQTLRKIHGPEKPIVWIGKNKRIEELVRAYKEEQKDEHLYLCQYTYGGSGSAAKPEQKSGHPNAKEQEEFSEAILAFLKENEFA